MQTKCTKLLRSRKVIRTPVVALTHLIWGLHLSSSSCFPAFGWGQGDSIPLSPCHGMAVGRCRMWRTSLDFKAPLPTCYQVLLQGGICLRALDRWTHLCGHLLAMTDNGSHIFFSLLLKLHDWIYELEDVFNDCLASAKAPAKLSQQHLPTPKELVQSSDGDSCILKRGT